MLRILLLTFVLAGGLAALLHITFGMAFVLALGVLLFALSVDKNGLGGRNFIKPSAVWKCPFCLKRTKLGATACHHCERSLVREA